MFDRSGIPETVYLQYEHEAKFKIARFLLGELESRGDEGFDLQRRLLTELCKLKALPDSEVPDRDAGLDALRKLKRVALQNDLVVAEESNCTSRRQSDGAAVVQKARERDRRLRELRDEYNSMFTADDPQRRGYDLEDLVKELFALSEIRYRKSYRADGEQIDGHFAFGGFDYLVEARWRKNSPSLDNLLGFKGKVERKIESTRGFFISIPGFDEDVLNRLRQVGSARLVFVDGYDLSLILEGRIALIDALQAKTEQAAQKGMMFFRLTELFK